MRRRGLSSSGRSTNSLSRVRSGSYPPALSLTLTACISAGSPQYRLSMSSLELLLPARLFILIPSARHPQSSGTRPSPSRLTRLYFPHPNTLSTPQLFPARPRLRSTARSPNRTHRFFPKTRKPSSRRSWPRSSTAVTAWSSRAKRRMGRRFSTTRIRPRWS